MSDDPIARKEALADIAQYESQHVLQRYRGFSDEDWRRHADWIVGRLRVAYGKDLETIAEEMHEIAARIAQIEHDRAAPDGHHRRAAQVIRERADSVADEDCPWSDCQPWLTGQSARVADHLWDLRTGVAPGWIVYADAFARRLFGDEFASRSRIDTAVGRLRRQLQQLGCDVTIRVRKNPRTDRLEIHFGDL